MNQESRIKNKKKQLVKKFFSTLVFFVIFMTHNSCIMIRAAQGTPGVGLGIETSVADNPYSRAAQQLQQKASELDERQKALNELQAKIEQGNQRRDQVLVVIGLSLFSLITLNYYLDLHRRKFDIIKH